MKHTQGPWKVVGAFNGPDFAILPESSDKYGDRIAKVEFSHSGMEEAQNPTVATANANLIAAAPEMINALIEANEMLNDHFGINDDYDAGNTTHDLIRQAIKKATE